MSEWQETNIKRYRRWKPGQVIRDYILFVPLGPRPSTAITM